MPDFPTEKRQEPTACPEPLTDGPLPQEVEVAAMISLEHVVHVEASISAARSLRGCRSGAALRQHRLVHEEIEPAIFHAQPDAIAGAGEGARAAHRGLGRV